MVFGIIGRAMERYIAAQTENPNDVLVDNFNALALRERAEKHQE